MLVWSTHFLNCGQPDVENWSILYCWESCGIKFRNQFLKWENIYFPMKQKGILCIEIYIIAVGKNLKFIYGEKKMLFKKT